MKKGFISEKFYIVLVIFSLLFSILLTSHVRGEVAGPGWFMGEAEPVSPEEAQAYYSSEQGRMATQGIIGVVAASATSVTPEIAELARALQYDPKLIYDYVHNHIDYVPYYGSLKGATLTYLDGSGNDFDQASLMIALLRESSNYNSNIGTIQYIYGNMTIPYDQLANWLGVDNDSQVIGDVIASGGIPVTLYTTTAKMTRVWIKAVIDGTAYLFDPAFKSYQYTSKVDIGNATGYNQGELLTAAQAGATVGTDYVQNLNEANINDKLKEYSTNLINTIRSQYPNHDVKEIIGGRSIIQTNLTQYSTSLPFSPSVSNTWDEIPTSALYTANLKIQHLNCGSGIDIDHTFNTPDLAGKRLTIAYVDSDFHPELRLDGVLIDAGASTTQGNKCQLDIRMNHPYAANNWNYGDQQATYWIESGRTYAIMYNFGGISDILLQKRQQQLDSYLDQGLADTSEEVLGETLNLMGLTWLKELQMTDRLLSSIAETVSIHHHHVGLMAQEAGYYIDVKVSYISILSQHDINSDRQAHFKVWALIGSALEHGILEQLMGSDNPGISTMKLFQIANTGGNKVFYSDDTNFSTIQSQLQNYSQSTINNLQSYIDNGYALILPENGQLGLGTWSGTGYIAKKISATSMSIGMIISGGYYGGYVFDPIQVDTPTVTNTVFNQVFTTYNPVMTHLNSTPVIINLSDEPVDMASGAYIYEHTDLSLGSNAPLGLVFSRFYNSNLNLEERTLGYGWTHNYDIYFDEHSHGDPGLGSRQPVDASALIAKLYAAVDLLKNDGTDHLLKWVVSSLASKWAVDQLIDNTVTVHLGIKLMEFIKLPDGTYSPPPGVTTQLIDNGDNTFSLRERFETQLDFDTNNRITQLTDVDGNPMTFTYNSNGLETVQDAFNRTLTLSYNTDGRIDSVSDSAGRSVSYTYDIDGNLTTYTDPESKVWGYGYDDPNHPHRMTSLTNPLLITTATNAYDSLGRVKTQTVPRQVGNATYNFYFSGFRNMEEDPDGYTIIYFYDEKGRPIGEENQLGYKSAKEYDGQFHVVKTIDPRTYETLFQYDGNQNLTKTINALTQSTDYIYDAQFRLTDTIDPLFYGIHIDYDAEHHPELLKYGVQYDGSFNPQDNGIFQTSATYYANGLTETTTDGRLTVTTLTYDSYGNPQTSRVGTHPAITTVYDLIGLLNSLTDQVGAVTNFPEYNNRGQLKRKTDPLLKDTIFKYDDAGRLSYKIDRNSYQIDYSYTPTSKVETITYPDLSTVSFTYNQHDDLTGMQDALGSTSYIYDAAHRLRSVTDPNNLTVSYTYNEAGNLTELTYPGNKKIIYTYDALNRLETVTINWIGQTATYHYDNAGRLDWVDNFNGTVTDYDYDNANRLTDLVNKKSDETPIATYHFTLDGNGNRERIVKDEPLSPTLNLSTINYAYNLERNRLETAGASNFTYDDEGQLSSKDGDTYSFDYEHRLKAISGANNYQFYYDGVGNRLKAERDGVTTKYIYGAAGNPLAEADNNNIITGYYIHGHGLMAMVTPSNNVYTYHFNAVGSTMVMTDENEDIVNKYAYTPFGILAVQQETVSQPFKFVGKYGVMTELNGFYYMRARYYDPEVGRFISEDPIGFDGGDVNLYVYVGNNPVLYTDPGGLLNRRRPGHYMDPGPTSTRYMRGNSWVVDDSKTLERIEYFWDEIAPNIITGAAELYVTSRGFSPFSIDMNSNEFRQINDMVDEMIAQSMSTPNISSPYSSFAGHVGPVKP